MPKTTLPNISNLRSRFSQFHFVEHEVFHWSPRKNTIFYNSSELKNQDGVYQLLHEIGHALSSHNTYTSGVQLLRIESEAWAKAKELAKEYNLTIDQKHIEHCLDSYRDWLHLRSTCPNCSSVSIETEPSIYRCFNCMQIWKVPTDQRSRHYRLRQAALNS